MKEKQLKLFQELGGEEVKRKVIRIPLDTFVLLCVANLFLLIIAFSSGVERGKQDITKRNISRIAEVQIPDNKNLSPTKKLATSTETMPKDNSALSQNVEKQSILKETTNVGSLSENYVIQVASYLKKGIALKELDYLKRQGYLTTLKKKGKYFVLYIEKIRDKKKAERIRKQLRPRYGNCIIRRL